MGNLLTICIPTYNRSVAVDWVLKILKNYLDRGLNFDVLVCDNASTDDTKLIVEKWLQSRPSLTYYCQKGNRGSDYNFLTCYKLFKTKYCWLLGDTRMIPFEKMEYLISELERNKEYDAFILNSRRNLLLPTKEYTDINELMSEQGWHITNMVSCIITQDFVDTNHIKRYLNTYFLQVGNFVEHLCSLDKFKVKYIGISDIAVNEFFIPAFSKSKIGWLSHATEIFARDWYGFVMSLPNQITLDVKEKVIKDHNKYTRRFSKKAFIPYFIKYRDPVFVADFKKNKKYLGFTSDVSLLFCLFTCLAGFYLAPVFKSLKSKRRTMSKSAYESALPLAESFIKDVKLDSAATHKITL